ncbi:hypothetical protein SAMN04488499_1021106, partial [Sporomusa acidovorans]
MGVLARWKRCLKIYGEETILILLSLNLIVRIRHGKAMPSYFILKMGLVTMKQKNLLAPLADCLEDKRSSNQKIPFGILLILAVTAKLKLKTSLTDVPFAVTDAELLSELGWNVWDTERDLENGLFSENVMRRLIAKYDSDEFIAFYNRYVQEKLLPELRFQ